MRLATCQLLTLAYQQAPSGQMRGHCSATQRRSSGSEAAKNIQKVSKPSFREKVSIKQSIEVSAKQNNDRGVGKKIKKK